MSLKPGGASLSPAEPDGKVPGERIEPSSPEAAGASDRKKELQIEKISTAATIAAIKMVKIRPLVVDIVKLTLIMTQFINSLPSIYTQNSHTVGGII